MIWTIANVFAILALAIGSYTDLRTREVPDWLSHGTIYFGFALNAILSIVYLDWHFIVYSVLGFALCFLLGLGMYKLGQWGGGDTKVIMGVGALVGLNPSTLLIITFLVNTILVGAVYGIGWSLFVALRNWKSFWKEYRQFTKTPAIIKVRLLLYVVVIFGLLTAFLWFPQNRIMIIGAIAIIFFLTHFWIMIKVVEKACMIKEVNPSVLTEGDWIAEDVKVKGEVITGPGDLGVSLEQIAKLKKIGVRKVKVKYGIPFVPSFLIAFILAAMLGAWYLGILQALYF